MRNTLFRSVLTATAVITMAALGAPALEQPAGAQAPTPQIRIDFRAVTGDGKPVTDLSASDVTVRIAGKPRAVTSLELVEAKGGDPKAAAGPATPAFTSNAGGGEGGRTLLLVIDDESIALGREQGLKAALTAIVDGLAPIGGDRVGLFSVRRSGGVNIAPTTDHAAVRKGIDAITGQGSAENSQDFRCRTTVTLQQLESLVNNATGDAPTTIAFFSASLMGPGEQITAIGEDRTSDLCRLTAQNFEQLTAAVAGSRAHVYVTHVAEGTSMSATDAAIGVESVAGVVGTETLRLSGDGGAVAERILAETSAYYVATLAAEPSDKGANQRMEVRVAREGVAVRAHHHVTPMRLVAGGSAGGRGKKVSPRDMIRTAESFRDLPLRASGYTSRNQGDDKMRIVALFEPETEGAKLTSAVIGLFSPEGKLIAQWTAQDTDLARSPAMAVMAAPAGTYRMRVAAADSSGRSGTVDHPLDAQLVAAGAFMMSTPLLGPAPAQGGFAPKLLFTAQDNAVVSYLEIYGVPKGASLSATLELAPNEDAPPLGSTDAQIRQGPAEDARIVLGGFSIDSLAPGDYTVRTVISLDGKPVARAVATMRKTGPGS